MVNPNHRRPRFLFIASLGRLFVQRSPNLQWSKTGVLELAPPHKRALVSSRRQILDRDRNTVEPCKGETIERFVIGGTLVTQDTDRYLLAEEKSLLGIRAPMHPGHTSA
jgi:hypothetical protein